VGTIVHHWQYYKEEVLALSGYVIVFLAECLASFMQHFSVALYNFNF